MGTGQIISDTFGMVKARFGQLLALWVIYMAITVVLSVVMAIGVGTLGFAGYAALGEGNPLALGGGVMLLVILFYLGYLLVAMAQYGSLIAMASPVGQPTVGDALGRGWRAAPALLLLLVVLLIGYFAVATALGLVGTAFAAIGEGASAIILLLMIPVLAWLGCRLAPLFAVVAVEGTRNPFAAIARAWRLTRGHALTIFLASLAFLLIVVLACAVLLLPSLGLLRSLADPAALADAGPAVGGFLLFGLGLLAASVLFNVCYCAFIAVIHGTLFNASEEGLAEAFA